MKSFTQFITEVVTQASAQATKMGLQGDGHGDWYDKKGKLVAKTVSGSLQYFGDRNAGKKVEPADLRPEKKKPENKKDGGSLTFGFGRFNPPTTGHEKLMDTISKSAGEGGQYRVYPSRSQDAKKNPLDPREKIDYMRKMFPKHANAIVDDENTRSILDVLKGAHAKGYKTVNVVVGSDRVKECENLANKYNGQLYDFDKINIISAGDSQASNTRQYQYLPENKARRSTSSLDLDFSKAQLPRGSTLLKYRSNFT